MPVTIPETASIVILAELVLVHTPPVTPALKPNVVDDVPHTMNEVVLEITGIALSVTINVEKHTPSGV